MQHLKEKILVIGSNSFSGASFIDYLLKQKISCIGVSRSPEPNRVFLPYKWGQSNGFKFYQLDLNHDLKKISNIVNEFKPDYVVNFAAQSMVAESWQYPEDWYQTNVIATVKLHDILRRLDFIKKYVHVSTPEVYGSCQGTVEENIFYNPSTPYAVSRAAADMSLMTFFKTYNFPVAFTRAANVYGPGQQLYRIIPRTIFYFLTGNKLQLHGGGHAVRSFIHIRDVADGTLRVARRSQAGEIYHLSTSKNISIRSLVKMIAARMQVSFEENVDVVADRPGKDAAYLLSSAKAKTTLDWKAKINLEHGIDETIAWVKDNLKALKKQPFEYIHKH